MTGGHRIAASGSGGPSMTFSGTRYFIAKCQTEESGTLAETAKKIYVVVDETPESQAIQVDLSNK